jgi:transposase
MFHFLKKLFADGGYQIPEFNQALARVLPYLKTEIVKRSDQAKGFVVLPKRWLVARTFAWVNRCRRLAKDWETSLYEVTGQTLSEGKMSYEPDSKDNYRASDSLTTASLRSSMRT